MVYSNEMKSMNQVRVNVFLRTVEIAPERTGFITRACNYNINSFG